jgi:DNA polymerase III delta prime subunit
MREGYGNMQAVVVAGPTCSGKSALALALAETLGGVIINADAMQVYRELRVLTARPSAADEALVPHALYGVRPAAENSTAAWWRDAAIAAMQDATRRGLLPILCGGTGLYLASLTQRLAAIPDPGEAARAQARALMETLGPQGLHARLTVVDPLTAARLHPSDSQRLARAWEVFAGTGKGLASWQADPDRSAAAGTAGRHRTPVRGDARRRRHRGSRRLAGAEPAHRAAGHAGAWRARNLGLSARRDEPGCGDRAGAARHRTIHQASGHVVSTQTHCSPGDNA